jgi:hypothetical protein
MKLTDYVTIAVIVPESHADLMRTVLAEAGAGESRHYSHGSFSVQGTSRFMPKEGSRPFMGKPGTLETSIEERIETICHIDKLEKVLAAVKKAHPYEETVIDILPIYDTAFKRR